MATLIAPDTDSDFGYDFSPEEEQLLLQLASSDPATARDETSAVIDAVPGKTDSIAGDIEDAYTPGLGQRLASQSGGGAFRVPGDDAPPAVSLNEDVRYPNRTLRHPQMASLGLTDSKRLVSKALSNLEAEIPTVEKGPIETVDDGRSPLQRFRSFPRKPLTVTDLTSGSWCELQYWYTLTRLPGGRRTRTQAMRQGTKLHQKLEDEVHTTVKIDITSKEDGFGLRLWNLVQGLRTLRDTGLTRELEVWGMADDNLVNGIIDSVGYENPNPTFEAELSSQESQQDHRQRAVTDYFPPKKSGGAKDASPKIYLTDVKTRGSLAPVSPALLRPAKIQLLLYHRFLSDMAAGRLDFMKVFRRYGLDPDEPFSDTFIAQIGELHDEIFEDAPTTSLDSPVGLSGEPSSLSEGSVDMTRSEPDLLKYRCLRELLQLVGEELKLAFPWGEESLGHMLRVQYLYRADGRELDLHDFPVSRQALDTYLTKYMGWWRGERTAKGVEIEEAFKCRSCEFVSDCSWRQSMDEDRVRKAHQKVWARRTQP